MGRLTERWTYEMRGAQSDSKQKERALFLSTIQELRPDVITSLFQTTFVGFVNFVTRRFGKYLEDSSLPPDPSRSELFEYLWNIPEDEVQIVTTGGWNALQRMKGTKELRKQLRDWSQAHNIEANWCLDHAVKVLRSWFYDDRIRLLDVTSPSFLIPEISYAWEDVVNDMQFDLAFSRAALLMETDPAGSADPPLFVFDWKGIGFEATGWNYLQEGKGEWKKRVEQEFDRFRDQRKAKGQPVPKGVLTVLHKELAGYMKKRDTDKRAAISQHGLVKAPQNYADHGMKEHAKWIVMYQIPPCLRYADIAQEVGEAYLTIRKNVEAAAKRLGLTLRNPREHTGRPIGSRDISPRRSANRRRTPRARKSEDK